MDRKEAFALFERAAPACILRVGFRTEPPFAFPGADFGLLVMVLARQMIDTVTVGRNVAFDFTCPRR